MEKRFLLDRICAERRYISVNHGVKFTIYIFSGLAKSESIQRYLTKPLTGAAPHLSLTKLFVKKGLFNPWVGQVRRFLQGWHPYKIQDSRPMVKQGMIPKYPPLHR